MKAFNRALIAFLIDNLLSYYLLSIIFIFYLHDVFPSLHTSGCLLSLAGSQPCQHRTDKVHIHSLLRFLFYDHVCYMDCRLLFEASLFSLSNFFICISIYYTCKLIASNTECIIGCSYAVYNTLSYITKDLISDRMTIYIIDRLEKIKIHKIIANAFPLWTLIYTL